MCTKHVELCDLYEVHVSHSVQGTETHQVRGEEPPFEGTIDTLVTSKLVWNRSEMGSYRYMGLI